MIYTYYKLFPDQLLSVSEQLVPMLREFRLTERNMDQLIPVLRGVDKGEKIFLINDLTIAFFSSLLSTKLEKRKWSATSGPSPGCWRSAAFSADNEIHKKTVHRKAPRRTVPVPRGRRW